MGLQINYTTPSGVNAPECYVYVRSINVIENQAWFELYYYFTQQNRIDNNPPIFTKGGYSFTIDDADVAKPYRKQAYEYAKTLDEFSEAIDILDPGQTA